jgi:hypothetical protein
MRLGASDRWRSWYKWLTLGQLAAATALSITSVSTQYEAPAGAEGLWYDVVSSIQSNTLPIVIFSNIILWAAHLLKRYFGNPWAWDTVKVLLEEFRADVFRGVPNISAHLDRVTLFKKRDWRLRCGFLPSPDWLCSVERSGHMTRRKRVWYRGHDGGRNLTGVTGATWGEGRTIFKEKLPLLTPSALKREIELYAKETFIDCDYIRKKLQQNRPFPRSLCGIMVEVNSKPWGVIVIDSSLETLCRQDDIEKFYQKNAKVLGKLLAVL